MPIEVRVPSLLRTATGGQSTVQADGSNVGEVLADLEERFPALAGRFTSPDGAMHKFLNVYLNDDDVRFLDKLATPVKEGDAIAILPAVAGG